MHARRDRRPIRAAWALVLLTTLCAELTFTAVALPATWLLLPLLMVMYGAGVLVIREAVVRTGAGWPSLVLLGVAYELAEDGIGLQALTSPRMYGAADWGWRALGVNWTYWASQLGVHVVFSVLVPVALAGLLFPDLRRTPYLGRTGFVVAGVLAIVGVIGLRVVLASMLDPGYRIAWGLVVAFVVAIAGLGYLALGRARQLRVLGLVRPSGSVPGPLTAGLVSGAATVVFLALVLPPGLGPQLLLGGIVPGPILTVASIPVAVGTGWAVLRWRANAGWSDRHDIWLIGGILVGHTAFMMPGSAVAMVAGAVTIVAEVVLLVLLDRRVAARSNAHVRSGGTVWRRHPRARRRPWPAR